MHNLWETWDERSLCGIMDDKRGISHLANMKYPLGWFVVAKNNWDDQGLDPQKAASGKDSTQHDKILDPKKYWDAIV